MNLQLASRRTESPRRSEAGSAYLTVLMLLVVLTILGLSLSVITQTEVIIGGSEKQATRQLFSANSGLHLQAAETLVTNEPTARTVRLKRRTESMFGTDQHFEDKICVTPFLTIHVENCNLCTMNTGKDDYKAVTHAVTVNGLRSASDANAATADVSAAGRMVGGTLALEPWIASSLSRQEMGHKRAEVQDQTLDADPSTEIDPCESLYIKF